jgi:hypothetical protein
MARASTRDGAALWAMPPHGVEVLLWVALSPSHDRWDTFQCVKAA